MTSNPRHGIRRLVLQLACVLLLGLPQCGTPTDTPDDDGTDDTNQQIGTRAARIEIPAELATNLTSLRVISGFGSSTVRDDGTCDVPTFGTGTQLAIVADDADHPLLMGWLSSDGGTINVRTTANVLAFFGAGGFALPEEGRAELIERIANRGDVDALAEAIRASLAESADSLSRDNKTVRSALTTLLQGWGFGALGKTEAARMLTDPSDEQSGVRINQVGVNRIYFRNRYRRAGYAFIERDSWYGTDNKWHESPEKTAEMEIPSVKGLNGAVGTFMDIINGDYAYAEVSTETTKLPVVTGSKITRYKVSVVGFGDLFGPLLTLPAHQQAKQREVALTWFVQDIFLPLVINVVAPSLEMQEDEYERFFDDNDAVTDYIGTMTSTLPAVKDALDKGDLRTALNEAWNGLSTSTFFMKKTLDLVMDLIQCTASSGAEAGASALGMANKILGAVGVVDQILYGFDVLQVIGALMDVRMAEVWTIDVMPPEVKLTPKSSDIGPYEHVQLEAKVPEATGNTGQEDPVFTYHWHNTGEVGSIADSMHTTDDFDSSSSSVHFVADHEPRGTDTITVEVFELDGSDHVSVGTASATVTVNGTKVRIVPETANIKPEAEQGFAVSVDPVPSEGEVVYVWSNTGTAGHLALDGQEDAFETTGDKRPTYTANADGRGTDFVTVEAFKELDGERTRLGSAQATVCVSPYTVSLSPKQTVIPNRGTAELKASLDPEPPINAQLIYRWFNTAYLGDLRGGNSHDSSDDEALYITRTTGTGSDHITVEVFELIDGALTSLGIDDATVTVGSSRFKVEFIPESMATDVGVQTTCNAVVSDADGNRVAGKTVEFSVSGVGRLTSPTSVTTSENGWALANFISDTAGVGLVIATVPGEAARESCPVVVGASVELLPENISLVLDQQITYVTAHVEPAIYGLLKYEWQGGGVGPSSWGIAGITGCTYAPLGCVLPVSWPGSVSCGVSVTATIDGHEVGIGGRNVNVEVTQDAEVFDCKVVPTETGNYLEAKFSWAGSPGDKFRILIYDTDHYHVLQPIPQVRTNTFVYANEDGNAEYVVSTLANTPENAATLQNQAKKLTAHVSWVNPEIAIQDWSGE